MVTKFDQQLLTMCDQNRRVGATEVSETAI
jgi:hypothetical protein